MKESLFANVDEKKEVKKQGNYYNEVLEKRQRPELPMEEGEMKLEKGSTQTNQKETKQAVLEKHEIDTVRKSATAYFSGDELAANVWLNKYALKDSQGELI